MRTQNWKRYLWTTVCLVDVWRQDRNEHFHKLNKSVYQLHRPLPQWETHFTTHPIQKGEYESAGKASTQTYRLVWFYEDAFCANTKLFKLVCHALFVQHWNTNITGHNTITNHKHNTLSPTHLHTSPWSFGVPSTDLAQNPYICSSEQDSHHPGTSIQHPPLQQ